VSSASINCSKTQDEVKTLERESERESGVRNDTLTLESAAFISVQSVKRSFCSTPPPHTHTHTHHITLQVIAQGGSRSGSVASYMGPHAGERRRKRKRRRTEGSEEACLIPWQPVS